MRASPWLPVLLLIALAAYLLPERLNLNFLPRPPLIPLPNAERRETPALPTRLPADTRALFTKSRPATVRVESLDPQTREGGIGTGTFIGADGTVLTAYHVVSGGSVFQVNTLSGRSYSARLTAFDAQADVALLKAEGGPFPFLKVTTRAPRDGETVLAIGNSGGDFLQPRRGRLLRQGVSAGRADFPPGTLEMDAPLAPGDSGGPILDGNGQVIGVVSYISLTGDGQTRRSYAVPVTNGGTLLTALRAGRTTDVPVVGLIFGRQPGDVRGALVSEVARNSPAARAGLRGSEYDENGQLTRRGDVVTSVNGQRTGDANDVIAAIRRARVGDTITLGYSRGGEPRRAQVTLVAKASVPDLRQ